MSYNPRSPLPWWVTAEPVTAARCTVCGTSTVRPKPGAPLVLPHPNPECPEYRQRDATSPMPEERRAGTPDRRTPPNSAEVMQLARQAWDSFPWTSDAGIGQFMVELGKVGLCITSMEQARLGGTALSKGEGH